MKIDLSNNIRALRKAHALTQQQLADALGVTVGAVYKWEANLSAPDLSLLVALADLFDTSVDVLLGYEVQSNKQAATVARLKEYLHNRDRDGLAEAEKALLRYPNSFAVVHECATLYNLLGFIMHDEPLLRRSVELMERSKLLLAQNTDPTISELSICNDIALAYLGMDDAEKALEILKQNNPCGINNDQIGNTLAGACNRPDEAMDYLSVALVANLASFDRIVNGYMNVFFKKDDYASGASILRLALELHAKLKMTGKTCYLDKEDVDLSVCLAYGLLQQGDLDGARESLRAAKRTAAEFDKAPDYSTDGIRYVLTTDRHSAFADDRDVSAAEQIIGVLRVFDDERLTTLWEEIDREEQ